uniref:Uncharacterized protein n=1 Tax=Acrobeloides nanus TaxID=290746 RepID=A0A914DDZ7_9BILA
MITAFASSTLMWIGYSLEECLRTRRIHAQENQNNSMPKKEADSFTIQVVATNEVLSSNHGNVTLQASALSDKL